MRLTPREEDRLLLFNAAELARRRRARGLRLNHPEAVALICDEVLEAVRDGRAYADVLGFASTILTRDEVMEGVPEMAALLQVEGMFADGTKLLTLHRPIR